MGIETPAPVINAESTRLNFTNEGGIDGTTRFLKNITGMWLLEQSRKVWAAQGRAYSYGEMEKMARSEAAFPSIVNPDDPRFAAPANMVDAIDSYLRETGQPVPESDAQYISCIYHSLAVPDREAPCDRRRQRQRYDEPVDGGCPRHPRGRRTYRGDRHRQCDDPGPCRRPRQGPLGDAEDDCQCLCRQDFYAKQLKNTDTMKEAQILNAYELAKERYAAIGVDTDKAVETLEKTPISLHCWQTDDVIGFESAAGLSGGIQTTGNYPGRARNIDEVRADVQFAKSLIAGNHRLNLHEIYGDFGGKFVDRDEVTVDYFQSWIQWAKENNMKLDFNSTSFGHPKSGDLSLANPDPAIREFWIESRMRWARPRATPAS